MYCNVITSKNIYIIKIALKTINKQHDTTVTIQSKIRNYFATVH